MLILLAYKHYAYSIIFRFEHFFFSDFDGLLRLQRIFRTIPRTPSGEPRFHIEMVKRISSVSEAIDFLHSLEKQNRDSIKHVLLDCSANLAKEIIVQHVRSVHLGRRNYHYMMSGLVLDDYWDNRYVEMKLFEFVFTNFFTPEVETNNLKKFVKLKNEIK